MSSAKKKLKIYVKLVTSLFFIAAVVNEFKAGNISSRRLLDNVRHLSRYLGNGQCEWTPPLYEVPEDVTFFKTLIAGYPSGDKRLTFLQMEALTGLSARDEWDFVHIVSKLEVPS